HPPLAKRVAALVPSLQAEGGGGFGATLGALAMAFVLFVLPVAGGAWVIKAAIADMQKSISKASGSTDTFRRERSERQGISLASRFSSCLDLVTSTRT